MLSVSLPSFEVLESPKQPTTGTIKLTTQRLARLLEVARRWDEKHPCFDHKQEKFFLEQFAFADAYCIFASAVERRHWDIPEVVYGCLYTRCER